MMHADSMLDEHSNVNRLSIRFFICYPQTGELLSGSKDSISSYHLWQFESLFDWTSYGHGDYPLEWKVSDIDQFVKMQDPPLKTMKAFS